MLSLVPSSACAGGCTTKPPSAYFEKMVPKNLLPPQPAPPSATVSRGRESQVHADCSWGDRRGWEDRWGAGAPLHAVSASPGCSVSHQMGRLALAHHLGTTWSCGGGRAPRRRGRSQPLPRCSRVSGGAAEGPALSQPGAEPDLHPSVSKCTQIISLLRGTGIPSRQPKEERQQALS